MATSLPSTPLGIFTWKMPFLQNQSIFHWKLLLLLKYVHLLPGNQTIFFFFFIWGFLNQFDTIWNILDAELELKCFILDIMLHFVTAVPCLWKAAVQVSISTSISWYLAKLHPPPCGVDIPSAEEVQCSIRVTVCAPRDLTFGTGEGLAENDKTELKSQWGT